MASTCHQHSATPRRRRRNPLAIVLPAVGALVIVGASTAVVVTDASAPASVAVPTMSDRRLAAAALQDDPVISRSADRPPLRRATSVRVTDHLYVTDAPLEVHVAATDDSAVLATIDPGTKVGVTGRTVGPWTQVVRQDLGRWVRTDGLGTSRPLGTAPCPGGSAVESGLQPDTILVHRAVCSAFPAVVRWGGRSGGGEHATGRAIDIMIGSDTALGYRIADYARAHANELGVSQVIWHQHIWTAQRAGDGWRPMSNRGGATANHMDHVHVTTFGSSGTAG